MPHDPQLAQTLRSDLAGEAVTETKMFGGLAFLLNGHMVCGLYKAGTMYRVGKENHAVALGLPGARQMKMGDRPMAAMVELSLADSTKEALRRPLLDMALATVRKLPPKVAKPKKG